MLPGLCLCFLPMYLMWFNSFFKFWITFIFINFVLKIFSSGFSYLSLRFISMFTKGIIVFVLTRFPMLISGYVCFILKVRYIWCHLRFCTLFKTDFLHRNCFISHSVKGFLIVFPWLVHTVYKAWNTFTGDFFL